VFSVFVNFLFEVLCKKVLTNCLLKAEAFCSRVFAGVPLIVIMKVGVEGVFFLLSRFIVFHKVCEFPL